MELKNNIYGVSIIRSNLANFNADFSGEPKTLSNGTIYSSHVAYKYLMRNYWKDKNKSVFLLKSKKNDKKDMPFNTLAERYNYFFNEDVTKKTIYDISSNLMSCLDIKNFGITFAATAKKNFNINGVVQLSNGINLYNKTNVETQNVLSPFVNSNKEEATQSTIGSNIFTDEAFYGYSFVVNPNKYKNTDFIYEEKDFLNLKDALLNSASYYSSCSKTGIENNFGLFIYMKENNYLNVSILHDYVKITKEKNKEIIDITELLNILNECKDTIEKVEIYYNNYLANLIIPENTIDYNLYSILTTKEIK